MCAGGEADDALGRGGAQSAWAGAAASGAADDGGAFGGWQTAAGVSTISLEELSLGVLIGEGGFGKARALLCAHPPGPHAEAPWTFPINSMLRLATGLEASVVIALVLICCTLVSPAWPGCRRTPNVWKAQCQQSWHGRALDNPGLLSNIQLSNGRRSLWVLSRSIKNCKKGC